jgi:hypothetical protein
VEWGNSEGAHRKGADSGDARAESGAEEGLRWWKAGEADAWAVGGRVCDTRAWTDETNDARERKIRSAGGGSVLNGSDGEGAEGWASRGGGEGERERERGALGAAAARPRVGGALPRNSGI